MVVITNVDAGNDEYVDDDNYGDNYEDMMIVFCNF